MTEETKTHNTSNTAKAIMEEEDTIKAMHNLAKNPTGTNDLPF